MGKTKYLKDVEVLFKKSPVVSFSSIQRIVRKQKKIKQYAKHLVRQLILGGRIKKLTKGYYTGHDEPSLFVYCLKPAYLGLQDAMSFHNLWEQETIPVIITPRKIRPGFRKVLGMNVLIKRIDRKYFFGFDYLSRNKFYLPYSDVEKTLIDMVYFREPLSKEVVRNIAKIINRRKLNAYLKKYPKYIKEKLLKLV